MCHFRHELVPPTAPIFSHATAHKEQGFDLVAYDIRLRGSLYWTVPNLKDMKGRTWS